MNVETLRASVYAETDGQTLLDSPDTPIVHRCRRSSSRTRPCRSTSTPATRPTSRAAGTRRTAGGQPVDVHYDNTTPDQHGVPFHLGDTASFRLRLSDGTRYWDVNPSMTLAPYSYRNEQPLTCWGTWCSSSFDAECGKRGTDASQ